MTYSDRKANFCQAQEYLDVLEPDGDFTFQTFSDSLETPRVANSAEDERRREEGAKLSLE